MKNFFSATLLACALALALSGVPAAAQSGASKTDVFGDIGRWFDKSFSSVGDHFKNAGKGIDDGLDKFNRDASVAAKTTANAAVDAADAVAKLPKTRMMSGHQVCPVADNGAPDCGTAANKLCQAKGMKSGTSLDVITARECPLRKFSERETKPRECKNVTFVSRAMCQ